MVEPVRVSLLHATYRAGPSAVAVRATWLARARRPELVEHTFSMDADDELSVGATEGYRRVVNPPVPFVSAVRNWNAAASSATGQILMVVADDLTPLEGWDDAVRAAAERGDPDSVPWVVMAKELGGERFWLGSRDALIRHPIVSRAYYRRFGLFDPAFHGIGCDNDFTLNAFKRAVVFEVPGLVYEHAHPADVESVEPSESQRRMNRDIEFTTSRAVLARKWPWWRRKFVGRYPVPPGLPLPRGPVGLGAWHLLSSARKAIDAVEERLGGEGRTPDRIPRHPDW